MWVCGARDRGVVCIFCPYNMAVLSKLFFYELKREKSGMISVPGKIVQISDSLLEKFTEELIKACFMLWAFSN